MLSALHRQRRGACALRIAVIAGCAAFLAACNTSPVITGSVPDDYRERHPIVVKEGPRTVDLFIGEKRGNLTGDEERVLSQAIYDLRMRFVEVAQGK